MSKRLMDALAEFNEDIVLTEVRDRLDAGDDPMALIKDLQGGMTIVGDRFSNGDYFLSELMMSADLFKRTMDIIEPKLDGRPQEKIGKLLIGTPKGDIHDIGKNIFCTVAKGAGFEICDLGVDVPVKRFLDTAEEFRPDIIGFSALITTAFEPMRQVVEGLVKMGTRQSFRIIIGGGVTTETVRKFVGADFQTIDAIEGLDACRRFVRSK